MLKGLFIILIIIATMTLSAKAQFQVFVGPKVGISGSNLLIDNITISGTESFESFGFTGEFAEVGRSFGILLHAEKEINIGFLWFQPELLYTAVGGNYTYIESGQRTVIKEDLKRLDFPILVGYRIFFLRFFAGPVVNFKLESESGLNGISGFNREFKSTTFGFQVGAGIKIQRFIMDLKFERITNIDQRLETNGQSFDLNSRINQYALSFAYLLRVI
ncbi:MAG: hypothetical protein O6848_00495 [Bacteroidetes bacterium]|nr:hypothetical protein [Bacteroidota bacterium]